MIKNGVDLLSRLCNDNNDEDSLLRLIPNEGKEIVEFERSKGVKLGTDLKVVSWGVHGVETSKYAKNVPGDIVQTFRNYTSAVITHQVRNRMKRDGLLIMLDEFDVIEDKSAIGSLIKSLSSEGLRFAISRIARDLHDLVEDHASPIVTRLSVRKFQCGSLSRLFCALAANSALARYSPTTSAKAGRLMLSKKTVGAPAESARRFTGGPAGFSFRRGIAASAPLAGSAPGGLSRLPAFLRQPSRYGRHRLYDRGELARARAKSSRTRCRRES